MPTAALTIYNCVYVPPTNTRSRLDGDTFRCTGDVEAIVPDTRSWVPKVRLIRIDAPETGQEGAEKARDMLIEWLNRGPFNLICYERDKYGRLLADAEAGQGRLSEYMLSHNWVRPMSLDKAKELLPDAPLAIQKMIALNPT